MNKDISWRIIIRVVIKLVFLILSLNIGSMCDLSFLQGEQYLKKINELSVDKISYLFENVKGIDQDILKNYELRGEREVFFIEVLNKKKNLDFVFSNENLILKFKKIFSKLSIDSQLYFFQNYLEIIPAGGFVFRELVQKLGVENAEINKILKKIFKKKYLHAHYFKFFDKQKHAFFERYYLSVYKKDSFLKEIYPDFLKKIYEKYYSNKIFEYSKDALDFQYEQTKLTLEKVNNKFKSKDDIQYLNEIKKLFPNEVPLVIRTTYPNQELSQLALNDVIPLSSKSHPDEEILKNAKIKTFEFSYAGLTASNRQSFIAKFNDEIRAFIKIHDESASYSNYKAEVLSYEISKLFEFNLVPVTVERIVNFKKSSVQFFIENNEGYTSLRSLQEINYNDYTKLRVFDFLIQNGDRRATNFLMKDGKVFAIDHGFAFTLKGKVEELEGKTMIDFFKSIDGEKIMSSIYLNDLSQTGEIISKYYLGEKKSKEFIDRVKYLKRRYLEFKKR